MPLQIFLDLYIHIHIFYWYSVVFICMKTHTLLTNASVCMSVCLCMVNEIITACIIGFNECNSALGYLNEVHIDLDFMVFNSTAYIPRINVLFPL